MFLASKLNAGSGAVTDPQFNYVTMLLHGDGTNGAQNNTFLDSSSNNFTITRNGSTTQGTWSPYGANWSNSFLTSYLTVPSNTAFAFGSGDFTIEFWVYYASTSADYVFYDGRGTSILNSNVAIFITGGSIYVNVVSTSIITATAPSANTWHHIAFARSGTSAKLFVDGVQVGSTATNSTNISAYSVNIATVCDPVYISQYYLNGYISNLRVVKGTAVYTSNFTPSTVPLTAISGTSLLTCQSNRFIDNSSNNFAITVNGTPSVQRFSPFAPTSPYSPSVIGGSGYFPAENTGLLVNNASCMRFSGDFTIEGWFYKSTNNLGMSITGQYYSGNIQIQFDEGNTPGLAGIYNGAWNTVQCTSSPINQWFHLAFSRSGTTVRVYLNGVYQGAMTISGALNFSASTGGGIGAMANYWLGGWVGNISDFRASNTARYTTTGSFSLPTAPYTSDASTTVLASMTNAGILDNAEMNDLVTVGNAQISTSVKQYGTGSMYFTGSSNSYLQDSADTQVIAFGTGDFTVEMWVNFAANNSTYNPFVRADGTYTFDFGYDAGAAQLKYAGSSAIISASWTPTIGTWYHIALTRSSGSSRIFVNGVQTGSTAVGDTNNYAAIAFKIGGSSYSSSNLLNGYIDDLRITKGYARYTANFTPPTAAFPNQ